MRLIVYISIVTIISSMVLACINNKANIDYETREKINMINIVGKYEGNLPCADCSAISTKLILRKDRSYELHYVYLGKSEQEFKKSGTWKLVDDIIHLDQEDYNYKIKDNKLNQLDLTGKEITGSLASKYVLNRMD